MKYALGVDGGATKTIAVLGDEEGRILGIGAGGPSNYQVVGIEAALDNLGAAIERALSAARTGSSLGGVARAVFGLSGADFPQDFETLRNGLSASYPGLSFDVVNDVWVGFRAGTDKDYGGIVVSGTGANFAAIAPDGRKAIGRGLGYEWGSEGGAARLISQALHFAFRSHDGTGPRTKLQYAVLDILGLQTYDELALQIHQHFGHTREIPEQASLIVPAIFELARQGDEVSQNILVHTGTVMGEIIGGMLSNLGTASPSGVAPEEVDVVLAGSIFTKGTCPLMISALAEACRRSIPLAVIKPVETEPAVGGYLLALEQMGIATKGAIRQTAIRTFGSGSA